METMRNFRLLFCKFNLKGLSNFLSSSQMWNITTVITKCCIYLLSYLLTPWSRVLREKLTSVQLVSKLPAFSETRKFITAFTCARHLPLSRASSIQFYRTRNLCSRKKFEVLLGTLDYFRFWPTVLRRCLRIKRALFVETTSVCDLLCMYRCMSERCLCVCVSEWVCLCVCVCEFGCVDEKICASYWPVCGEWTARNADMSVAVWYHIWMVMIILVYMHVCSCEFMYLSCLTDTEM